MDEKKLFDLIKEYFIEEFEIEEEKITKKANLFEDLGLDSLDALDMVAMLEAEMDIEVDEEELKNVRTIEDVINFILSKDDE